MKTLYGAAVLTAVAFISTSASAQAAQGVTDTRSLAVSYADLNLNTDAGQAVLKARLRRAAEVVCAPVPDQRDVKAMMAFERCMKKSLDQAFAAIPASTQTAGSVQPGG